MAKQIRTTVACLVTLEVEHPEDMNIQGIRLAARDALRQVLLREENAAAPFNEHPLSKNEDVSIALGDVEFE